MLFKWSTFLCIVTLKCLASENVTLSENCWKNHSGLCVEVEDPCPFKNPTENHDLSNEELCGTKNRRCCIPKEKPRESRNDGFCGVSRHNRYRIVGGRNVEPGEWPWQVNLVFTNPSREVELGCGGTIIHPRWVLTAAHCLTRRQPYSIIAGHYSRDPLTRPYQIVPIKNVTVHKYYRSWIVIDVLKVNMNDIALIELEEELQFNKYVNKICLPNKHEDIDNMVCTSTGFGRTKFEGQLPKYLQEVDLATFTPKQCATYYAADPRFAILNEHVCAGVQSGGRSGCHGDSGGPLVCRKRNLNGNYQFVQAGITSFGKACALPRFPGVYTRVTSYLDWIEYVTKLPVYDGSYVNNPSKSFVYKNVTFVKV